MYKNFDPETPTPEQKHKFNTFSRAKGPFGLRLTRRIAFMSGCILIVLVAISTGLLLSTSRTNSGLITKSLEQTAGYPLYSPSPLPANLKYVSDSLQFSQEIVTYSLRSGYGIVSVSEQKTPLNPPDLSRIKGFNSVQVNAGTAYTGASGGRPVVIIQSNTTFMTINGDNNVPSDIIVQLAKSMHSLEP